MEEIEITEKGETVDTIEFESINIEQNGTKFILNIESNEKNYISFSINDKNQFISINYIRKMNFKEIQNLNKVFDFLYSISDFYYFLKSSSDNKKLNIKKYNDKITLIITMEVLYKDQIIEIDLFPSKNKMDLNIKEICKELINMKTKIKEINNLKNEINNLNKEKEEKNEDINILKVEIEEIKKENNNLKSDNKELNHVIIILRNNYNKMKEMFNNLNNEIIFLKREKFDNLKTIISLENKIKELTKEIYSFKSGNKDNEIKEILPKNKDNEQPKQIEVKPEIEDNKLIEIIENEIKPIEGKRKKHKKKKTFTIKRIRK